MSVACIGFWCFFFQAEDGIRDLVRSRGLGDVYKRQSFQIASGSAADQGTDRTLGVQFGRPVHPLADRTPVSYTHLTLPTSDLV